MQWVPRNHPGSAFGKDKSMAEFRLAFHPPACQRAIQLNVVLRLRHSFKASVLLLFNLLDPSSLLLASV
jgi:hypothetical protein